MMISMVTVFGSVVLAAPVLSDPAATLAGDEVTVTFDAADAAGVWASLRAMNGTAWVFLDQYLLVDDANALKFPIDDVALKGEVITITVAAAAGAGTFVIKLAINVDKSALQAAYDAAPTNEALYYAPTWAIFKAAYDAAGDVLAAVSTQKEVDDALADLLAGIDQLLFKITGIKINAPTATTVARGGSYVFEVVLEAPGAFFVDVDWTIANTAYGVAEVVDKDGIGKVTIKTMTGSVQLIATDKVTGLSHFILLRIM